MFYPTGPLCLLVKLDKTSMEKIPLHGFQGRGKEHQALADGAQIPSEHTSPEGEAIPALESRVSHIH